MICLLNISQIPDFLSYLDVLKISEIFFKIRLQISRIQKLIPNYKCSFSQEIISSSEPLSPLLSKGLPQLLEILSQSFCNFLDLNSSLTIIKVLSLTTVLTRFEEKVFQKYFIKQFRQKMKTDQEFNSKTFFNLIQWFDTIEYIYDFLTTELQQMMDPRIPFEDYGWIQNHQLTHSKILQILTQKLGFSPDLWVLSFFLNFDQNFYTKEVLQKSENSFLWGSKISKSEILPDANPNSLMRSGFFSESGEDSLFMTSRLLHWARAKTSAIQSPVERKSKKDSFLRKRGEIKKLLIQILSNALFKFVQKQPVKCKEVIMTKKNEFSVEMFQRLLMMLEHQGKPERQKIQEEPSIPGKTKPLQHIQMENKMNINPVNLGKASPRLSSFRKQMSFNQMRQHFKKGQDKLAQPPWRNQQEKFGTRSPMQRRKEWNGDKFHSQFGVKETKKEINNVLTSEFQFAEKKQ